MNRQDQTTVKMIVPGIIQALAVSPCGNYCVGGAAEQLFVWLGFYRKNSGLLKKTLPEFQLRLHPIRLISSALERRA
jgi:hypothetical protein